MKQDKDAIHARQETPHPAVSRGLVGGMVGGAGGLVGGLLIGDAISPESGSHVAREQNVVHSAADSLSSGSTPAEYREVEKAVDQAREEDRANAKIQEKLAARGNSMAAGAAAGLLSGAGIASTLALRNLRRRRSEENEAEAGQSRSR